jgi:formate hydrogenlyase subunit 3/multisubunit Na+/H+ antiporter MnhD subunit
VVWALSIQILKDHSATLFLKDTKGLIRSLPFAASGLVLANLALAGMPLLAGFPSRQALWEELAITSLPNVIWALVGSIGLLVSAVRVMIAISATQAGIQWESHETGAQRVLLLIGFFAILLLGLFPQWVLPLWTKLPVIFSHLGQ